MVPHVLWSRRRTRPSSPSGVPGSSTRPAASRLQLLPADCLSLRCPHPPRVSFRRGDLVDMRHLGQQPLHLAGLQWPPALPPSWCPSGPTSGAWTTTYHTPLDMAAMKGHMECVRYLDSTITADAPGPKLVGKLKDKASARRSGASVSARPGASTSERGALAPARAKPSAPTRFSFSSLTSSTLSGRLRIWRPRHLPYSQRLHGTAKAGDQDPAKLERRKQGGEGTFKISEDGRKSVRRFLWPAAGQRRGRSGAWAPTPTPRRGRARLRHVPSDGQTKASCATLAAEPAHSEVSTDSGHVLLFTRPGLGTMVFPQKLPGAAAARPGPAGCGTRRHGPTAGRPQAPPASTATAWAVPTALGTRSCGE